MALITRMWKQPQCPLTDDWIKEMWYSGISAIKRNEIRSSVVMWMNLESVIHTEVSQRKTNIIH